MRLDDLNGYKNPNRNLQIQLNTDGPIKYVEVLGGDMLSQSQSFRSCLSPMSEFSDFTFVKPSSTTDFKEMINVLDASLPDSAWTFESQQSAGPGHLINKLVGVDPDSGHNAWLFYSIAPGPHTGLFLITPHTGELRTTRKLAEEEGGSTYDIIVVVQDNGEPTLSTTVAITVTVEEKGASDAATDNRKTSVMRRTGMSDITLYLIISLACVSAVSFLTFLILMVRCLRHRSDHGGTGCCYSHYRPSRAYHQRPNKDLHLQLNTDGPIRYMEVVGGAQDPPGTRTYRPCYSTISSRSDFVFVKTPMMSHNNTLSMTLNRKHLMNSANEVRAPGGRRQGIGRGKGALLTVSSS
ncbi:unnamed protein product [Coregonus sp. 'balchen']|nr:unnamed protein product [Coregonus sp. 'balchen']